MITEFWQTEKDFIEFLNVIDEVGAEMYSYRGEKYNGLPFKDIYTTDFQGSRIFFKNAKVPKEVPGIRCIFSHVYEKIWYSILELQSSRQTNRRL